MSTASRPAPLDANAIVNAAIAIADADGIDAVSMRSIAGHLGVVPMALYRHVRDKNDLLDRVADALFDEIDDTPGRGAPARRCIRLMTQYRAVLLAHPALTSLLASRTVLAASSLRFRDTFVGVLRDGGLRGDALAHAYSALVGYTVGFTLLQSLGVPVTPDAAVRRGASTAIDDAIDRGPYKHLGVFWNVWRRLDDPGGERVFATGLRALVDGLVARPAPMR